jgi:cellulose synthase (UDP-forming)
MDNKNFNNREVGFEKAFTLICLAIALSASFLLGKELFSTFFQSLLKQDYAKSFFALIRAIFPIFVVYGNLVYLFSRFGHQMRKQRHCPDNEEEIMQFLCQSLPEHDRKVEVTFLLPSYREEIPVIKQSLFSSALQDCPNRRVVLLIDDPSNPSKESDKEALQNARNLPFAIKEMLDAAHQPFALALDAFEARKNRGGVDWALERASVADLLLTAIEWFEFQAEHYTIRDHTDTAFVELTFQKRAKNLRERRNKLLASPINDALIEQEYCRMEWMFKVEISSFERKRYCNLSHAPNKAMNLNSYIGLMGKQLKQVVEGEELFLYPAKCVEDADLVVPPSRYVAMLDADSVLTYDYAMRLLYEMEKEENKKIAVIQTPYSAFPNSPCELERIAGATTDMQYNIHQGFTYYGATFWVGANAIARMDALNHIAETEVERGYPIVKYIQDRTVIEDTESSIDLVHKGWKLMNYPERMSYSATPPDFGSLLIQRRRWANGGLLILPKMIRYVFAKPRSFGKVCEAFFRFHYLVSIPGILFGLAAASLMPLQSERAFMLLVLASLPYFLAYARDLLLSGYRYGDFFKVMALNILLVPVNLAGVLKSLEQAVTGEHIPFCRTPKVQGKTLVPFLYVAATGGMLAASFGYLVKDFMRSGMESWFADLLFFLPLLYATVVFMEAGSAFKISMKEKLERSSGKHFVYRPLLNKLRSLL